MGYCIVCLENKQSIKIYLACQSMLNARVAVFFLQYSYMYLNGLWKTLIWKTLDYFICKSDIIIWLNIVKCIYIYIINILVLNIKQLSYQNENALQLSINHLHIQKYSKLKIFRMN